MIAQIWIYCSVDFVIHLDTWKYMRPVLWLLGAHVLVEKTVHAASSQWHSVSGLAEVDVAQAVA